MLGVFSRLCNVRSLCDCSTQSCKGPIVKVRDHQPTQTSSAVTASQHECHVTAGRKNGSCAQEQLHKGSRLEHLLHP